jgi:hypothetical protein
MVFKDTGEPIPDMQVATIKGLGMAKQLDPNAEAGSQNRPFVQRQATDTFAPGKFYISAADGKLTQVPSTPSVGQDAWSGFSQPFNTLGHDVMENYRSKIANAQTPPASPLDFAKQAVGDVGSTGQILGDVLGLAAAPVNAFVRPTARALTTYGPTPYSAPSLGWKNGNITYTDPQALQGDAAQSANEGLINTALMGARAGAPVSALAASAPKPVPLEDIIAAKRAAYDRVDASGFKFPAADVQAIADNVGAKIREVGGPKAAEILKPSDAMHARLDALAQQPDGVPLTQLDKLRSDVYNLLVKPGGSDQMIGHEIRNQIDGLVNASDAPDIQEARDLNTRMSKMQAVSDKLDSAGLRSASTYSGGNYPNAVRQSLRPLVDPTSAQQIGNLTPAENTALRTAVKGTPGQNATRYASKFLTNKFVQVPASLMTHGIATPVMEAAGAVLNKTAEGQTATAVQRVLDLMSLGGKPTPKIPPINPTLALGGRPAIPVWSPGGLIGASAISRLPAQSPFGAAGQKAGASAR